MKITREASQALHNATVHLIKGEYISSDANMIETDISPEVVSRIMQYAKPKENISDVIVRLSRLADLLRDS